MRKTTGKSDKGNWLSITSFTFPEKSYQKVKIIYTNQNPTRDIFKSTLRTSTSMNEFLLRTYSSNSLSPVKTLSRQAISRKKDPVITLSSRIQYRNISAWCALRAHSSINSFRSPPVHNDSSSFKKSPFCNLKSSTLASNIFKPQSLHESTSGNPILEQVVNGNPHPKIMIKKPIHSCKILNFYRPAIKKTKFPERIPLNYHKNTQPLFRTSTNPQFLPKNLIRTQTHIPFPLDSKVVDSRFT